MATKPCPFCAEEIQAEARKCKHCGEFLPVPPQQQNTLNRLDGWLDSQLAKKAGEQTTCGQQGCGCLVIIAVIVGIIWYFG